MLFWSVQSTIVHWHRLVNQSIPEQHDAATRSGDTSTKRTINLKRQQYWYDYRFNWTVDEVSNAICVGEKLSQVFKTWKSVTIHLLMHLFSILWYSNSVGMKNKLKTRISNVLSQDVFAHKIRSNLMNYRKKQNKTKTQQMCQDWLSAPHLQNPSRCSLSCGL